VLQVSRSGRQFHYQFVDNVVSSFRSYASYLELFPKLKCIRQNLENLVRDMSNFHLKQLSVEFDRRRQTRSFKTNKEVFIHGEECDEKFVPIGKEIAKKRALEKR